MSNFEEGDIVQSITHPTWTGEVIGISITSKSLLISWTQPNGGHIRSWAYFDTVRHLKDTGPSRYEKAIMDRKK